MLNRYFINVGTYETEDKSGWVGCWHIYDRMGSDALQPLLSGRSRAIWNDAASSMEAAYDEALVYIGQLQADALKDA